MSEYPLYLTLRNSAGGDLHTERVRDKTEGARLMASWAETLSDGDTIKACQSVTDLHR